MPQRTADSIDVRRIGKLKVEVLVTASGGYGERVEHASEVQPALKWALKAVREEGGPC